MVELSFPDEYTRQEKSDTYDPHAMFQHRYVFDEHGRIEYASFADNMYTEIWYEYEYEENSPFPCYLKYRYESEAGNWVELEYYDYTAFDATGNWTQRKVRLWSSFIPSWEDEPTENESEYIETARYIYRE